MQKVQINGSHPQQHPIRHQSPPMSPAKALLASAASSIQVANPAVGSGSEHMFQNLDPKSHDFQAALARFLRTNCLKSSVMERFPNLSWSTLESAAQNLIKMEQSSSKGARKRGRPRKAAQMSQLVSIRPEISGEDDGSNTVSISEISDRFTLPELQLIVSEWYSPRCINFYSLQKECFLRDMNLIHSRIMQIEANYGDKRDTLTNQEIFAFEACNEHSTYTLDAVSRLLPGHSAEELRKLISVHYPHKLAWSPGETAYIVRCLHQKTPLDTIPGQLPFRRPSEVKIKAKALAKRYGISAYYAKSPEQEAYEAIIDSFIASGLTKTTFEAAEKSVQEDLSEWMKERKQTSGNGLLQDVQDKIEQLGGSSALQFTKAENALIQSKIQGEISEDECMKELPFRTPQEVQDRLRKAELVTVRQKKFANSMERLIYEAQWYSSMADNHTGRRKRRSRGGAELEELKREVAKQPRKVEGLSAAKDGIKEESEEAVKQENAGVSADKDEASEDAARDAARRAITQKRMESRQRNLREKERLKVERQRRRRPTRASTRAAKIRKDYKQKNTTLLEEAQWFQSITGNGTCVAEGDKRKRVPTYHLIPEFKNRHKLKKAQRKLMESRSEEVRVKSSTPSDFDASAAEVTIKELQDAMGSDTSNDEDKSSPFDPCSIVDDTYLDARNRDIYNEQISSRSLFPLRLDFSPSVHEDLDAEKGPVINDILAAKVIRDNEKGYTSLPSTFPPFRVQDAVNPRNILHIRFLLYPQHTEQYILAQPKSNQLDPVNEIQKVFQIHYGLYFAYSQELKHIIYHDYCEELLDSVAHNDFGRFMAVIDRWNALMLELTPYPVEIDPAIDINASLRDYLPRSYVFNYSAKEFRLQRFFMEVLEAGEKAQVQVRPRQNSSFCMKVPSVHNLFSSPEVFVSRFRHLRPMAYSVAFIDALTHVSHLSRFCIQQMILRAYIRIVSPDSRKLRSYKAFSAEVYGELLPSFISEVLSKIGFKPHMKFYDLGCGVANTTLQAALEFGAADSGGCEMMEHASGLASLQHIYLRKQLQVFGLKPLNLSLSLSQSFVDNDTVRQKCQECDVILVNNFLFEFPLNVEVGKLLYGLKPGSKIISLRNFISPRYKAGEEKSVFDYLKVEKFEISDYFSVSWTANKVPYYISTVQDHVLPEYLSDDRRSRSA